MFGRIKLVAAREFFTVVTSKGFLIGVFMMPLLGVLLMFMIPKIIAQRGAPSAVEVAVIDHSGVLAGALSDELKPETLAARRAAARRAAREAVDRAAPGAGQMADRAPPEPMQSFRVTALPAAATVDSQKSWLTEDAGKGVNRALVVVPETAVQKTGDQYDDYELYTPRNINEDAEGVLHEALRVALTSVRLRAAGVDPAAVQAAMRINQPRTVVVSPEGKQVGTQGLNRALPFIMGILLFMGVMMGGQALMGSTIEEKSSRVVEVLLAAVSPLELMWGKLIGQLGVGLVTMAIYIGLGLLALLQFSMFGLLDPVLILWFALFFLVAYLVYGSLMLSIGAAVARLADAQSLMGPVMLLLLLPYMLTFVIGRAPDSAIAVTASFIPPVNAFVMLARLASSSPPPLWQALLSLLLGIAGACVAVWFASKVFRIGLLLHGKPPSFGTLIKWARMS